MTWFKRIKFFVGLALWIWMFGEYTHNKEFPSWLFLVPSLLMGLSLPTKKGSEDDK